MTRFTLAQKVAAAFVAGVVVLAVGALSLLTVGRLLNATRAAEQTGEVNPRLERLLSAATNGETGQRSYLSTGDPRYLGTYSAARGDRARDRGASGHVRGDPVRRGWLDSLSLRVVEKFDELNATIALRDRAGVATAIAVVRTNRGKASMDDARRLVRLLEDRERLIGARSLAQLVVPELADWCAVAVRRFDGAVRQLAVAHVDPEKARGRAS